jgi:hypothetical protein
MEWDVLITKIVGMPKTGNKNFTAGAGSIGTEKGVNKKLRVSVGTVKKTQDFKNEWEGSIAFNFADEDVPGGLPFNCTFDEKTGGYYIFNIVP